MNHRHSLARWTAPLWLLAAGLSALVPAAWRDAARGALLDVLRPGVEVAEAGAQRWKNATAWVEGLSNDAEEWAALKQHAQALQRENQALAARLSVVEAQAAAVRQSTESAAWALAPELTPTMPGPGVEWISACTLGRQAQSVLARDPLLDLGSDAGLSPDALVASAVDPSWQIDHGQNQQLAAGDRVAWGRFVVGRLHSVGRRTSTVRRVHAVGFRDVVQLAHVDGRGLQLGPQAVWEGAGDDQGRLRWVPTSAAVSVGDWVLAVGAEGIEGGPLIYGRVSSASCPPGALYWDLLAEPIGLASPIDHVAVLRGKPTTDTPSNDPSNDAPSIDDLPSADEAPSPKPIVAPNLTLLNSSTREAAP